MYLKSWVIAILVIIVTIHVQKEVKAKGLKMRVISRGSSGSSDRRSMPWNNDRSRGGLFNNRRRMNRPNKSNKDRGYTPCVGLCYYMKVLEAEKKKERIAKGLPPSDFVEEDYMSDDENLEETENDEYSELGEEENTAATPETNGTSAADLRRLEKKLQRKLYPWEKPTEKPCVGLCYYYKKKGLDNPFEKILG